MAAKNVEVTGNLELEIDGPGLKASIKLTKDPDGAVWTAEKITGYLLENGVTEGYKTEDIASRLSQFVKEKKQSMSFIAAQGIPPEQPEPEQLSLESLPIPENLAEEARELFSRAAKPEIKRRVNVKVEREKDVVKKPKLPFLPAKKERVKVSETDIREEKVYIDPTVEWTGYGEEGQKVGEISNYKPGIPGRSILGEVLQPMAHPDPYFYPGEGVERRKNELFATHSGFIRKGSNWIEVLPFRGHDWEIKLSRDKASCLLSFNPGDPHVMPPSAEEILNKANDLAYPTERLLNDDKLEEIINSSVESGKALESVPICQDQDALIEITVTEDKLKGLLHVKKGAGRGKPLVLKEIGSAIKKSGFKNMDLEKIKKDLMDFYGSMETELSDYVLVEGKAPTKGPPRQKEYSVRFLPQKETEKIKEYITEHPEGMAEIRSTSEFPIADVQDMAYVNQEQRVIAISPAVAGEAGVDVYGNTAPGIPGDEPNIQVFENLEKKENVIIAAIDGIFDKTEKEGTTLIRLRPHKDAHVEIQVAEDMMRAYLNIEPEEGSGRKITERTVKEALKSTAVQKGLFEEEIANAIEVARNGETITNLPIAEGNYPKNASDSQLKLLVNLASGSDVTIKSNGRADYRSQDRITTVEKDQEIAEILPPQDEAEDGWDISGKTLSAKETKAIAVEIGKNIKQQESENGVIKLFAECEGQLYYDGKKIYVDQTYNIKGNVDLQCGNIKFPGSVYVTGSVTSGFYIVAGGEIKIGEGVEAALLSAEDDIIIKQGVKGAGKAVLRSKKRVAAQFVEQATVLAVGEVQIKNSCVRGNIKTNEKLRLNGDKSTILGGHIRAKQGLEVNNIGSQRGIKTEICFGQNYLIADQIEIEQKQIEKLKNQQVQLDNEMRKKENITNRAELERLRKEKVRLLKILEKRNLRLFTLRERFEEHFEGSEIVVRGTIYPGVVIESHGRNMEISSPKKNIAIYFDPKSGRILERPLSD